jgi:uncharacterized protein YndB with AHSA1/START domain
MTIARFPVPPIIKTVTVRAAPARAFALFADDFARWWPLARTHTGPDPVDCAIEPRVGGRVFERAADGRETPWGTVLAYDPPHRLAFSWVVELPAGMEQLVEIRFTAEDRGTRVELTHSGWEQLGDAAASLRERYDRGWGSVFERHFVDYADGLQPEQRR